MTQCPLQQIGHDINNTQPKLWMQTQVLQRSNLEIPGKLRFPYVIPLGADVQTMLYAADWSSTGTTKVVPESRLMIAEGPMSR